MAVVGLGTDIAEIERVEKALSRSGEAFAQRILTDSEFEVFQQLKQKGRYLAKRCYVLFPSRLSCLQRLCSNHQTLHVP